MIFSAHKMSATAEKGLITQIGVTGMTCAACSNTVTGALEAVAGVKSAQVSLILNRAVVEHSSSTPASALLASLEDAGFEGAVLSSLSTVLPTATAVTVADDGIETCTGLG